MLSPTMESAAAKADGSAPAPGLGLYLLPLEIWSKIVSYIMISDVPVDIELFTDMASHSDVYEAEKSTSPNNIEETWGNTAKEEQVSRLRTSAPKLSKTWWLDLLPKSQTEHYLDWLVVNGTCSCFRELGKIAFFSDKIYIVSPRFCPPCGT